MVEFRLSFVERHPFIPFSYQSDNEASHWSYSSEIVVDTLKKSINTFPLLLENMQGNLNMVRIEDINGGVKLTTPMK